MQTKNKFLLAEEIKKSFGQDVSNIKKEWKLCGVYHSQEGITGHDPDIEPEDPLIFVELLEYLKPEMTFIQFKKIVSNGIWEDRIYQDSYGEFHASKTLDLVKLVESIEKFC